MEAKLLIERFHLTNSISIRLKPQLQQTYLGADIFLSGELTIDFPEDVKIPDELNQRVTAEVVGSSLKLNYCGLSRAIVYLREQYAVGNIEVKIWQS